VLGFIDLLTFFIFLLLPPQTQTGSLELHVQFFSKIPSVFFTVRASFE